MSELYQSLSPSKWDCKYHVVFVPKRRRKTILGQARRQLGAIFQALARQKECQIIEGHLMPDQVHMWYRHSPKAPGGIGDRISQREERNRRRSPERPRTQLYGRALLGPVTQYRPSGSNWNRSVSTSASRKRADGAAGQF